jgi:hypothetical protein
MGLFSKHKSSETSMPPAPPSADGSSGKENSSQSSSVGDLNAPPIPEMSQSGNLSPPPIPGGSGLDDIKEQVSSNDNSNNLPANNDNNNHSSNNSFDSSADSLFDDMFSSEETSSPSESSNNFSNSKELTTESSPFDMGDFETSDSEVGTTDLGSSQELGFVRGGHHNPHSGKDSCFLTTVQFKALLEIVEGVKSKVKDSTEVHLRLMDIKSEEDIEYENLRKNFAQMEDKLYELDTILFEEDK